MMAIFGGRGEDCWEGVELELELLNEGDDWDDLMCWARSSRDM